MCPVCKSNYVKGTRANYVGIGDYNIIYYECYSCGHKWEEKD